VRVGYDSNAQIEVDIDGVRKGNVLDRTPFLRPGASAFNTISICYKPHPEERRVELQEAGSLPVESHPASSRREREMRLKGCSGLHLRKLQLEVDAAVRRHKDAGGARAVSERLYRCDRINRVAFRLVRVEHGAVVATGTAAPESNANR
jgi:hypothetical protein